MPNAEGTATAIEVNGFAFREIRIRSGIEIAPCAEQIGISRSYLAHIELGSRVRVSASVFARMISALHITDRRALLTDPHGPAIEIDEETLPRTA